MVVAAGARDAHGQPPGGLVERLGFENGLGEPLGLVQVAGGERELGRLVATVSCQRRS